MTTRAATASELLRLARRSTGLSQRAFAALAGTSAPTVAAYESGSKEPRISTLERIGSAIGFEIEIRLRATDRGAALRERRETRSLALAAATDAAVSRDFDQARRLAEDNLDLAEQLVGTTGAQRWVDEWRQVLATGPDGVRRVLLQPGEHGHDMRQMAPFAGLLSDDVRRAVLDAVDGVAGPPPPAIRGIDPVTGPWETGGMVALTHGSPFTYDDLQRLPDDGYRHELLDGVLLMTPSPSAPHQVCVLTLAGILRQRRPPGQIVLVAPFDYVVSQSTVLVPDVLVARRDDLTEANLPATPLLVVEVLSPSTRRIDGTAKRQAYEDAGVPAYWMVDPDGPVVTVLELEDGRYREVAVVAGEESVTASLPFPVEVTPARLLDDLA